MRLFIYPVTPPLFIAMDTNRTTTTRDSPIVVLGSAVGVLKKGFTLNPPFFPLEIVIINGNRNKLRLEKSMNANNAEKKGINFFLYLPNVPKNIFSIK